MAMGRFWTWVRKAGADWWRARRDEVAPPPYPGPARRLHLGDPKSRERKEWVQRYFRPRPPESQLVRGHRFVQASAIPVVVGIVVLVMGSPVWTLSLFAVALVLFSIGLGAIRTYHYDYRLAEIKPTAQQLDRTLNRDLTAAAEDAMATFGLTPADLILHADLPRPGEAGAGRVVHVGRPDPGRDPQPLVFAGPAPNARHRPPPRDRVRRFTHYSVAIVCLGPEHLAVQTFDLDLATGGRSNVDTHEYHYDHVAAVNTTKRAAKELSARDIPGFGPSKVAFTLHDMAITSSGGTLIPITTEVSQKQQPQHPEDLTLTTSIENAMPTLRRLLQRRARPEPSPTP
jgi:hypothetical protein